MVAPVKELGEIATKERELISGTKAVAKVTVEAVQVVIELQLVFPCLMQL